MPTGAIPEVRKEMQEAIRLGLDVGPETLQDWVDRMFRQHNKPHAKKTWPGFTMHEFDWVKTLLLAKPVLSTSRISSIVWGRSEYGGRVSEIASGEVTIEAAKDYNKPPVIEDFKPDDPLPAGLFHPTDFRSE